MHNDKQVEYAPLKALGELLEVDGSEVVLARTGDAGYFAAVRQPSGCADDRRVTVSAPSLGLLVRALELVVRGGDDLARVDVGEDGELVDAGERESRLWEHIRRKMGPVIELQEFPEVLPGRTRVEDLAYHARTLGEAANGWSLPDHLLRRAALGVNLALRGAESGYMPSAALLVDFIAAQFEQSADGETDARKAAIWTPVDMTTRFKLPEPWDKVFGRIVHNAGTFAPQYLRGGAEDERFLTSRCALVRVTEDVYQAAGEDGFETLPESVRWSSHAATRGGPLAIDGERVQLGHERWAVRFGEVWIDDRYIEILRGLDVVEVFVSADGVKIVAPGVAVVMQLEPSHVAWALEHGPEADPRPKPEVGQHYLVTHDSGGGRTEALVRITYKSDQRLLAVCEARRGGWDGEGWRADGLEAEWSTSYGEWRAAIDDEVAVIKEAIAADKPE